MYENTLPDHMQWIMAHRCENMGSRYDVQGLQMQRGRRGAGAPCGYCTRKRGLRGQQGAASRSGCGGVETAGEDSRPAPPRAVDSLSSGSSGGVLYCWLKASPPPPADQRVDAGSQANRPGGSDVLSRYTCLYSQSDCQAGGCDALLRRSPRNAATSETRNCMLTCRDPFWYPARDDVTPDA